MHTGSRHHNLTTQAAAFETACLKQDMFRIIVFLVAGTITPSAIAAEWIQGIGHDYEVGTGYMEDGRIHIWQRNKESLNNSDFKYIKVLRAYDCPGGYFVNKKYILTTHDEREIEKEGELVRTIPQPDSADEINLHLFCKSFEEKYSNSKTKKHSKKPNSNPTPPVRAASIVLPKQAAKPDVPAGYVEFNGELDKPVPFKQTVDPNVEEEVRNAK
ncbi:MAG: hypothetical protein ABJA60_06090, partial [Nitrosospira sp.]